MGFLGKTFRTVQNVMNRNRKKRGDDVNNTVNVNSRLIDTKKPRTRHFSFNFGAIKKSLSDQKSQLFGKLQTSRVSIARAGDRFGQLALATQVALNAPLYKLPNVFAGEKGADFATLIRDATTAKKAKYLNSANKVNASRVTGFELWEFICDNKYDPTSIAYRFAGYTELQVRQLAPDWLDLTVTPKSLAKTMSDFATFHSPEHKAYLDKLGLNEQNAGIWYPRLFEDRMRLDIHSFSVFPDNTLRVTYQVPTPIRRSRLYKNNYKIIAADKDNFFPNTNVVNFTIVVEFAFNSTTQQYDRGSGTLITGFLHNLNFNVDDIETFLNVSPNYSYWGGSKGATKKYLRTVGVDGMPKLENPVSFQVLNKAVNPSAQQAEAMHPSGFIDTHRKSVKNLFGQAMTYWIQMKKSPANIVLLISDPNYRKEIQIVFGPLANLINQNFAQRLQIIQKDRLIDIIT